LAFWSQQTPWLITPRTPKRRRIGIGFLGFPAVGIAPRHPFGLKNACVAAKCTDFNVREKKNRRSATGSVNDEQRRLTKWPSRLYLPSAA
jgi:hypothetical protein